MRCSAPVRSKSRARLFRCVALVSALVVMGTAPTADLEAQEMEAESPREPPLLEQVHGLGLDSLKTGKTTVHYSAGFRDRARSLGARVERAVALFNDSLETGIRDFHLIVVAESDWSRLAEKPYGFPVWGNGGWQLRNLGVNRPSSPPATIVPADARGVVHEQLLGQKDCLSSHHREQIEELGLTWKEAARRYVRLITFHEVGHAVHDALGIGTYSWLGEFLPNYFAYLYLHRHESEAARVWDIMSAVTLECYTPRNPGFEQLQLSLDAPSAYHWFESSLIQRAGQVSDSHGFRFAPRAREVLPAEGALSVRADSLWKQMDTLSDEEAHRRLEAINDEILRRLEPIAPGFEEWAESLRAASRH